MGDTLLRIKRWFGYDWPDAVKVGETVEDAVSASVDPPTEMVDLGGKHLCLARPQDYVDGFWITEHQIEAHSPECGLAPARAHNLGQKVQRTTREALEDSGAIIYEHECLR